MTSGEIPPVEHVVALEIRIGDVSGRFSLRAKIAMDGPFFGAHERPIGMLGSVLHEGAHIDGRQNQNGPERPPFPRPPEHQQEKEEVESEEEHRPMRGSDRALDNALITAPEARDKKLLKKLDAVAGRVLKTKR